MIIYYRCPQCGKKGVNLRVRGNGEDHYGCRYCTWSAYAQGNEQQDFRHRADLAAANPGAGIAS